MRPERRQLLARLCGIAAIAVQAWLVLRFEAMTRWYWGTIDHLFGGFTVLSNRISQLKPAPFKAPWSWLYLALFTLLMLATLTWMWIAGFREAGSRSSDEPPPP